MPKRSASTEHKGQDGPEPHTALRALARLLGRQAARQLLAEKANLESSSLGDQDCNASRSLDSMTKPA
jgi:hypothetical protein